MDIVLHGSQHRKDPEVWFCIGQSETAQKLRNLDALSNHRMIIRPTEKTRNLP
jgi:hypothetical protein